MGPTTPYGAWTSPLSAREVFAAATDRVAPHVDGEDVWWLESRPEDEGRVTLVRRDADGVLHDVSPRGTSVRTAFHEYGGGAFAVADGLALYVDHADQRVYRWRVGQDGPATPVTPDTGGRVRWAGFVVDHARGVAFCLREDQRDETLEPVTSLARIDLAGPNQSCGTELVAGRRRARATRERADLGSPPDFVLDPVLSPDGSRLAWISWNHPRMAWEGCWLWAARLDDAGDLHDVTLVAGSEEESVEQPRWPADGRLVFLSDRTGFGNLHVAEEGETGWRVTALHRDDRDFGQPRWTPDQSSYDVLPDGRLVTTRVTDGWTELCVLDPATGDLRAVPSPLTAAFDVRALGDHHVVCRAMFADRPADVVAVDLRDGTTVPLGAAAEPPDPALVSRPESLRWAGHLGATVHGFLYPPRNPGAAAADDERPPLLVTLHGGPTAAAPPAYSRARTFWTSRGFAVLDVNYAGSTGFGRAYRQRLDGAWGVADVADVAAAARHLVEAGRVDPRRTAITGGSAGGYTTLAALTFTDAYAAGASHFGISDLAALAAETHKLESRYLDGLVAPWPEGEALYRERSPIHHVDRLATPLILLQGTEDRVVPPNQAEAMADAVRAKGLPVALVLFEGEGHGFRDPANRARALECELSFYGQVLGFTPAGDIEPVLVENT